jgi:hypothetical protein
MIWRSNATPTPPHLRGLGRYSEEGRTRGVVNARGVGCTVGRMPYPNTTTLAGELRGVVIGRLNSEPPTHTPWDTEAMSLPSTLLSASTVMRCTACPSVPGSVVVAGWTDGPSAVQVRCGEDTAG